MDLKHRRRFTIANPYIAWAVIGFVPAYLAVFVVMIVQGWLKGAGGVSGVLLAVVMPATLIVASIAGAGVFAYFVWVPGRFVVYLLYQIYRLVFSLLQQIQQFVMGANAPRFEAFDTKVQEEFMRTHVARSCPTCGGTQYVLRDNQDRESV
jgi:hypothetical protein